MHWPRVQNKTVWPFRLAKVEAAEYTCRFAAMGTEIYQQVHGVNAQAAAWRVSQEIQRLDSLWSPYRCGNIVDNLRDAAGKRRISADADTLEVIRAAKRMSLQSHKVYDITSGPLIRLWRQACRKKLPPSDDEIQKACEYVNMENLLIGPDNQLFLQRKGQSMDLGGIGKGFAADRAREIYYRYGIRRALINLGGNVLVLASNASSSPWRIGVKNPFDPRGKLIGYVKIRNGSVVTSGGYEKYFEYTDTYNRTQRYHHILDPRTGRPADSGVMGVTVVSTSSTLSDSLATAAFILGREEGTRLCERLNDTHILFVDNQNQIHMSKGMAELFTPLDESRSI